MSDLRGLAAELEQRATSVELIGDQLVHLAAIAIWSSVAADAFRAQVDRRHSECGDVASMLRSAASAVRHFAAEVEAEKERLRRIEEASFHGVAKFVSLAGWL